MKDTSQKAAALQYNASQHAAPKLLAKGKGLLAQKIIQKAKEFDIPLFANEALVNSLLDMEIESEIPAELYQTVAELFAWLAKQEKELER